MAEKKDSAKDKNNSAKKNDTVKNKNNSADKNNYKNMRENPAGWIFAATGLVFMAIGIWRGEVAEVCSKAIKICLECIGIG
ncbi:MAG: hypothetical protein E7265_06830 [Lachnospiraceae bacterium]|nr:hypothetical protein [Lachnospiraceae bacterium]